MTADAKTALSGIFAASLTPVTPDRKPDLPRFVEQSKRLMDSGCDGLGILGTTGEASSLGISERCAVIEHAANNLPADKLIVGTGACAVDDAITVTKVSVANGSHHVLVLPPFYFKPVSDEGLYRFFSTLIEGVSDDRLRVYLYNFPQLTGINFSLELLGRLKDAYPGIVVGMKDSSGNRDNMVSVATTYPDLAVFPGSEKLLLDLLKVGGAGCISATVNVTSAITQKVYSAWKAGEDATAAQEFVTTVRGILDGAALVPGMRALTARRTGDDAWRNMIPPQVELSAADEQALVDKLEAAGFKL